MPLPAASSALRRSCEAKHSRDITFKNAKHHAISQLVAGKDRHCGFLYKKSSLDITPAGDKHCWDFLGNQYLFGKEQRPPPCGFVPGRRQRGRFATVTLHGCPQQFGTKTCLKAAASMCGGTNDFKGNKSTSAWLRIIKRKRQPFVNKKKKKKAYCRMGSILTPVLVALHAAVGEQGWVPSLGCLQKST